MTKIKAAAVIQGIEKATNEDQYSFVFGLGWSKALESAGCGRVIVQVGSFDAIQETDKAAGMLVN